jgi:hypothetical protein
VWVVLFVIVGLLWCPADGFAQGALTNGGNDSGVISVAGESDDWTFTASQGDAILLKIAEGVPNSALYPWIRLFGPTNAQLASSSGAVAAAITVTAPLTGTYTVRVTDGNTFQDKTGSYVLRLVKTPGAIAVPAGDEGGLLTNGGNHAGVIEVGDLDAWTFDASKDDAILLKIGEVFTSETDPGLYPWIRLFGPTGALLGSNSGLLAAALSVTAPLTGTYTVVVTDGNTFGDKTGNYLLRLVKTPGVLTVPTGDEGGPLTNGANHAGVIQVGDLDPWTFDAAKNDAIVLKVGEVFTSQTDPGLYPWIRLFSPTGEQLGSSSGPLAAEIAVTAPLTGRYTVVVTDGNTFGDKTGNYLLRLVKTPGAVVVPTGDEGGPLTNGGNHAGVIQVGDLDPWTFDASKNDSILLKIGEVFTSETDPGLYPWIRLFGPNGDQLASSSGYLAAAIDVTAPLTGTYTVVVSDGNTFLDRTGSYLLRLVKTPGPVVVPAGDDGGTLTSGVARAGAIQVGDLDPWTFDTIQGGAITVRVSEVMVGETDPGLYPWIRLFGPTGALLRSSSGALVADISVTAPLTGTYTVVVTDGNTFGDKTGNYTLTATFPAAPGPVAPIITAQPSNQTVRTGGNASFTVAASGTPTPTYSWQVSTNGGSTWSALSNTAPYTGVTTATLTVTGASKSLNSVQYRAIATNSAGTATSNAATLTVRIAMPAVLDADRDGKTDLAIFRPSSGTWFIRNSATGYTTNTARQWGLNGDVPVAGDYDGDGQMDLAVYRPASAGWYILQSSTDSMAAYTLGPGGDLPVPGDYDGDGKTDPAVYHRSNGVWSILMSGTNHATATFQWGLSGDIPVPSDYDGDGKTDLAVYRPSTGRWYVLTSSSGSTTNLTQQWGLSGDVPVPGDYDGDGITDIAVYRPASGLWFILQSTTGFKTSMSFQWGLGADVPVPGDYDGDGKTDLAVFRPSSGTWFIRQSSTGYASSVSFQWGLSRDIPVPNAPIAYALVPLASTTGDFDGDRKADVTVFRPSTGTWFSLKSGANFTSSTSTQFGLPGDIPVPGDYDGDGKADIAVYRPGGGTWYILKSSDTTLSVQQWGLNGDIPVPGDYDGDGKTDVAVFRPGSGTWYVLKSNGSTLASYAWGVNGDTPVAGDYDGDGISDPAVFRPSTGTWFILKSSGNFATSLQFQWGLSGDIAVPGDFDGDGKTDLGVYRPSTGTWFVSQGPTGSSPTSLIKQFGLAGDIPVEGDYDGDGKADLAVFRPSTGTWFHLLSGSNYVSPASYQFGLPGDIPILERP